MFLFLCISHNAFSCEHWTFSVTYCVCIDFPGRLLLFFACSFICSLTCLGHTARTLPPLLSAAADAILFF